MKDYEAYVNNGNLEVPEYSKELKIEYFDLRNNILPGESMDSFENSLACGIGGKTKSFSSNSSQGKTLDDVQELTNAVSQTTGSIVEGAGAAVTGTATAVVGAAAAVIAFNATTHVYPKMNIKTLESGQSYVHYDFEAVNLDLDKDYDIVIKNNRQEFRFECVSGENEQYVYDLLPGLQYSLTLVGYNELLGEIEYDKEYFYTLKSDEILGPSKIDIIYNDDLTCGISYRTTLIDDKNKVGDTYIVVRAVAKDSHEEEDWILFHSLYQEEFSQEQADMFTYNYEDKVHSGTIKEVPEGRIYIDLFEKGPSGEEDNGTLISTSMIDVVYPVDIVQGANYVTFNGDYNLIKDVKNINVKNDNLVVRLSLYNSDNVETLVERNIDVTNGTFANKMLVKQDTESYSYVVGYYDDTNTFIPLKSTGKNNLYGGYYDGYYSIIAPTDEEHVNITWGYNGNEEICNITLLTGFENWGNKDAYYKVELLKVDYNWELEDYEYAIVDTYIGTGNAVFKNVPVGEYEYEEGSYRYIYEYVFRYTQLMNYYKSETENEVVEMEVVEQHISDDGNNSYYVDLQPMIMVNNGDFELLSNGKFAIGIHSSQEDNISSLKYGNDIKLKMYFFNESSEVITQTVDVKNPTIQSYDMEAYLIIDEDLPTGVTGYYAEYEVPYCEKYGGNLRTIKTFGKTLMGDISSKIAPISIQRMMQRDLSNVSVHLIAYMPDNCHIGLSDGEYHQIGALGYDEEGGYYYYSLGECNEGEEYIFDVFDENNNARTTRAYYLSMEDDLSILSHLDTVDITLGAFIRDNIVFTYNGDGTININLIANSRVYGDEYNFDVTYTLYKEKDGEPDVYNNVSYVSDDGTIKIVNFNNEGAYQTMNYYDTFKIEISVTAESTDNIPIYTCWQYMRFSDKNSAEIVGSNIDGYSAFDSRVRCIASQDDETGKCYYELVVPVNAAIDENQEITINGNYNGDDLGSFNVALKDTEIIVDDYYGFTTYKFEVDTAYYECIMFGNASVDMKFNYTLTKDKLEQLGNNYSGNLYDDLSLSVSLG